VELKSTPFGLKTSFNSDFWSGAVVSYSQWQKLIIPLINYDVTRFLFYMNRYYCYSSFMLKKRHFLSTGEPSQGLLSLIIPVTKCGSYWSASSICARLRCKAVICKAGQPLQYALLHSPATADLIVTRVTILLKEHTATF
jgi:hypothetical protein